ncbi:MAG: hypothetical protein Unbinned5350contig1001_26 [Prokaryotic dsDNA virus sp.]|nr:MAG: hypothetical protein Unbinned5350contig1001_26 [Prokaryotic dsDNA virus sp.]|tara:strand:- start:19647 stop:20498 length:852 start_codon:yes stop_codon:yes gene_type:complete
MKKHEIIPIGENRKLTTYSKSFLKGLRDNWGAKKVTRKKVIRSDETGEPIWGDVEILLESGNRRLNKGIEREVFYEFAEMIKSQEEEENINSIVEAGYFEVNKAIAAFKTTPNFVMDRRLIPKSFDESEELGISSIASLVKYKGEQKTEDLIFVLIMGFVKKFGKRNDLNEGDIVELCQDIVSQFRSLNIADIKMIFNKALFTSYKKFNLDYASVLEILNDCKEERMKWAIEKQTEEHRRMTGQEKSVRFKEKAPILSGDGLGMEEMMREIKLNEDNQKREKI